MNNRYSGDPRITITADGARMLFKGGQPILDSGIENAVTISLFSKPGWWGNTLVKEAAQKIGSNFEQHYITVDIKTINDVRDNARLAIKWMEDTGLVSKAEITVVNPRIDNLNTTIILHPPGVDIQKFLFTKNGLTWIAQATIQHTGG